MWIPKTENLILYEDKDIIVCHKPAGLAVQNARIGSMDLESALKNYLAKESGSSMPYLAVIHRLDQPVEGVLVFAKTPNAAKELSRQMTVGQIKKDYLAVTFSAPEKPDGTLEDWLKKDGKTNTSQVVSAKTPGAKKAKLSYTLLETVREEQEDREKHLIHIRLETGRHHQIRVQMAHAKMPLAGDRKYNPDETTNLSLGLCSVSLEFIHPGTKKKMKFTTIPEGQAFQGFTVIHDRKVV
jgi:23S rRNA pseudouridine1911/1915/1917 synthase